MSFISFDNTLLTGEDFFDSNNKELVDSLNVLAEKFRNNGDDISKLLKDFEDCYKKTTKDGFSYMNDLGDSNEAYAEFLNKIQLAFIESTNLTIIGGRRKFSKEYLEQLREMVFNLVNLDKMRAKFLQQNIKLRVSKALL